MDNGFATALLINNPEKESLEVDDCHVLLTNYTIDSLDAITPLLVDLKRQNKIFHLSFLLQKRGYY